MDDAFEVSIVAWISYRIGQFDLDKPNVDLIAEARAMLPASTNMMVTNGEFAAAFDCVRFASILKAEMILGDMED